MLGLCMAVHVQFFVQLGGQGPALTQRAINSAIQDYDQWRDKAASSRDWLVRHGVPPPSPPHAHNTIPAICWPCDQMPKRPECFILNFWIPLVCKVFGSEHSDSAKFEFSLVCIVAPMYWWRISGWNFQGLGSDLGGNSSLLIDATALVMSSKRTSFCIILSRWNW